MNAPWLKLAVASLLWLSVMTGCASSPGTPAEHSAIRIVGSDTMLPLNRHLAAEYMTTHPGSVVTAAGGGTAIGVDALIEGHAELCAASRPLLPREIERLYAQRGTFGFRTLVALDGIAIFVHPDNPVENLSLEDLAGLFSGTITRWSAVGGDDRPVHPIIRPPTSGTHRFVRDHVLEGRPFSPDAGLAQRTIDVIDRVAGDPDAIGFGGLAYQGAVRHCAVEHRTPTPETIREGSYALARYLYLFIAEPVDARVEAFVAWVESPRGQAHVDEVGLIPLWPVE